MAIQYQLQEVMQNDGTIRTYGKVMPKRKLTSKDLVTEIQSRGSTVTSADMLAVIQALTEICYREVMDGNTVQVDKLFTLYPAMKGTFDKREDHYNPNKQSLTVRARPPKELRKQIKAIGTVERIACNNKDPFLFMLEDIPTVTKSTHIVPGNIYKLTGVLLKINTKRDDEGLYFAHANNNTTRFKVTQYITKGLKEIVFVAPDIEHNIEQVSLNIASRSRKDAKLIRHAALPGILAVTHG